MQVGLTMQTLQESQRFLVLALVISALILVLLSWYISWNRLGKFLEPLKQMSEIADTIILSRPEVQRASMPEELMKSIPQGSVQALICNTIAEALSKAVSGPHQVICVAGSFYTVGEVCGLMGIDLFAKETAEKLSLV